MTRPSPRRRVGGVGKPNIIQWPVVSNGEPAESANPGLTLPEEPPKELRPEPHKAHETEPIQPEMKYIRPKRMWLERWLFPDNSGGDKRGVARKPTPGLTAQFWTGGAPQAHIIRDISASGMYVVTEERWYLGTQILITLAKTVDGESPGQRSITMHAIAVRWGDDGVGLKFVLKGARNRRRDYSPLEGADEEQLERFMENFKDANSAEPQK